MIDPLDVDARRLRLAVEGSHAHALASGGTLTPSVELGLRHDGGDGETGAGVELGAGLAFTEPAHGLTVEGRGRVLVAHQGDYEEWGLSGHIRIDPGADGRGLAFSLAPSLGETGSGVSRLWNQGAADLAPAGGGAANDNAPAGHLEAELGYGFGTLGGRGLLTPYGGFALQPGGARDWRLGGRFEIAPSLTLSLEGTRRESAADAPEHGIMPRGQLRF